MTGRRSRLAAVAAALIGAGLTTIAGLSTPAFADAATGALVAGVVVVVAVQVFDVQRDPGVHRKRLKPLTKQLRVHLADFAA